ncbi:MAG: uracil-DNA glycosylase [Flavobacteriaceae bacterium]|jgi:uracil-DNA glycosylase
MNMNMEVSWSEKLSGEFDKTYFKQLVDFVRNEYEEYSDTIFPKENEIFRAFEQCPFEEVKVVILGQDPYPTRGNANGLCFSVESNVRPLPKSLVNIYTEIKSDVGRTFHENGDLNRWASQGVLLLNSVLTVREGEPDSHKNKGWEQFTDAVIQQLNSEKSDVVYILWGNKAIRKAKNVSREKNLVLTAPHPSPLSSYRGFFGCKHFSKTNDYLAKLGKQEIIW